MCGEYKSIFLLLIKCMSNIEWNISDLSQNEWKNIDKFKVDKMKNNDAMILMLNRFDFQESFECENVTVDFTIAILKTIENFISLENSLLYCG